MARKSALKKSSCSDSICLTYNTNFISLKSTQFEQTHVQHSDISIPPGNPLNNPWAQTLTTYILTWMEWADWWWKGLAAGLSLSEHLNLPLFSPSPAHNHPDPDQSLLTTHYICSHKSFLRNWDDVQKKAPESYGLTIGHCSSTPHPVPQYTHTLHLAFLNSKVRYW